MTKHSQRGPRRTPTYISWASMRQRCLNPRHRFFWCYGGRGIGICAEWASFERFYADMGRRPKGKTLDRIDPDGDYSPGNCRWATILQQNRNRNFGRCHDTMFERSAIRA